MINLPIKIAEYSNVQQLVLSDNQLSELPGWLNNLQGLQVLTAENNKIVTLVPEALHLPHLVHLNLRNNQISNLPVTLCLCRKLRYLNVEYNNLTSLPSILSELPLLESIRVQGNPFQEFPLVLTKMKRLKYISLGAGFGAWRTRLQQLLPHVQII